MDLYVYYKVPAAQAAALQPAVAALQQALAEAHGVQPQLKRRPGEQDGVQTWMEIYPGVSEGFCAALDAAVTQAGLPGPRHTEIFVDLAPCA